MKRREIEMFNLSFLDILSGALGAVLFLFIVVPKGGESPSRDIQMTVTLDTSFQKFYGELPDSLLHYQPGDSLLIVVQDYGLMPQTKDCPPPKRCPDCPKCPEIKPTHVAMKTPSATTNRETPRPTSPIAQAQSTPKSSPRSTAYKGDLPSVPCKFSVEVKWDDIADNVDLYVCKAGSCVFGGKRRKADIGFWDSGKSKTSIFGGDLRTTQEAVRQFDNIIAGEYDIYLQFKNTENETSSIPVSGLVYTKNDDGQEQGQTFEVNLPLDKTNRLHVGTMTVDEEGKFNFERKNTI